MYAALLKSAKWWVLLFTAFLWTKVTLGAEVSAVADSPEWKALIHYRPALLHDYKSTVDSKSFFLSPKGKTNPTEELNATLSLFQKAGQNEKKCLFPARYRFLENKGFPLLTFPECEEYEKFKQDVKADGVTLLFTDAYMNNPSSLFGHTLIRIDIPEGKTQLMSHGVNYGAFVSPDENGIRFVVYGLFGGYWGGFTIKPYYDIINTYNNIENRDIWEYKLNIHGKELDFFIDHLWEVGNSQTKYFFFSENCSYMLMEVLDAVRPSLKLADDFPAQAIPLDTLKSVQKRSGLIEQVSYRPSRQKRIQLRYDDLTNAEKKTLLEVLHKKEFKNLSLFEEKRQSEILQTAYEWTQYQQTKKVFDLKEYRSRSFEILGKLSKLPQAEKKELAQPENPVSATHESMRFELGIGSRQGDTFTSVAFHPAYHSLTDRSNGFLKGAQINFFNTELRYYNQTQNLVLQGLDLIDIRSLAPKNALFSPLSYQVKFGVARELNNKTKKEGEVAYLSAGFGATYEIGFNTSFFMFANAHGKYGGFIPANTTIGLGGMIGTLTDFGKTRILTEFERILSDNAYLNQTNVHIETAYSLTKNTSIALEYKLSRNFHRSINEYKTSFRFHF